MTDVKTCPRCELEKPTAAFGIHKTRGKERSRTHCNPCRSARASERLRLKKPDARTYLPLGGDVREYVKLRVAQKDCGFETPCWLWQLYRNSKGYSRATFGDVRTPRFVHRISYEAFVGPIPEGLQIDHRCRVKACVNPEHLRPVTPEENLSHRVWGNPNTQRALRAKQRALGLDLPRQRSAA